MADDLWRLRVELDEVRKQADYWKGRAEAEWLEGDKRGMERIREHVAERERDALAARLAAARTWRGVQAFIDEQYPTDVFPVEPDSGERDDGARILSLLRRLAAAEKVVEIAALSARHTGDHLLRVAVDAYRTHEPEQT